ncbi:MAG: gliding motility-associated C-terminal domain-containing protein [Bacteroidia bacterium]
MDFFAVTYVNMDNLTVKIYDRWGRSSWQQRQELQWDSRFNGNPLPGTYYYTINYKFTDNEVAEEKRGNVMILR